MKHSETRDFWLQRKVGLRKVTLNKVAGPRNLADSFVNQLFQEMRNTIEVKADGHQNPIGRRFDDRE